jgi:hypothetical protein
LKIGELPPIHVAEKFKQANKRKVEKYIGREEQFFKDSINNFKVQANITKRKLAKLFDLCKENYVTNEELLKAPKRTLNELSEKFQKYSNLREELIRRYE